MSAWDLCGIGIETRRGLCGRGGGIAGTPSEEASRRESGSAIASSMSRRSTSPVTATVQACGLTRAPAAERQDLVAVVELERRADALEAVGELGRAAMARAAEEEAGRELGEAMRLAFRRDPRGNAPAERDERVRRQGRRHEDGAVSQHRAIWQVHAAAPWAWNRTTDRCWSTRYVL